VTLRIGVWGSPVDKAGLDFVVEAERFGADSVWVPEYWGFDALTQLAAAAVVTDRIRLATGIAQLGTRTPAMLAMSALTMQHLSGGRFVLGLGTSGPQVMEGWHGVPFDRPIARTRETIEIIRRVTAGERLAYDGDVYQLPLPGGDGKAIRSAAPPAYVPIYLAALGPANLRLTGAAADGWIGNSFFTETAEVFTDAIRAGAEDAGRSLDDVELTVSVGVEFTDDVDEAAARHARGYAFTFGAMGSASTNFYNDAFARQGWGPQVAEVQRLWLAGDREAAAAAVPIEIGLRTNLIGPPDEIRRRLREYQAAGVTTLRVQLAGDTDDERLEILGQLIDLAHA